MAPEGRSGGEIAGRASSFSEPGSDPVIGSRLRLGRLSPDPELGFPEVPGLPGRAPSELLGGWDASEAKLEAIPPSAPEGPPESLDGGLDPHPAREGSAEPDPETAERVDVCERPAGRREPPGWSRPSDGDRVPPPASIDDGGASEGVDESRRPGLVPRVGNSPDALSERRDPGADPPGTGRRGNVVSSPAGSRSGSAFRPKVPPVTEPFAVPADTAAPGDPDVRSGGIGRAEPDGDSHVEEAEPVETGPSPHPGRPPPKAGDGEVEAAGRDAVRGDPDESLRIESPPAPQRSGLALGPTPARELREFVGQTKSSGEESPEPPVPAPPGRTP
jgi:hypothetical protein